MSCRPEPSPNSGEVRCRREMRSAWPSNCPRTQRLYVEDVSVLSQLVGRAREEVSAWRPYFPSRTVKKIVQLPCLLA